MKLVALSISTNLFCIWLWEFVLRNFLLTLNTRIAIIMSGISIYSPWFILFILSINLLFTSIALRKQNNSKPVNGDNFDTIENPGIAIHKKTKELFCLKCLLQKNIKSPLIIDHSKGYMCRNCGDIIFHLDNWHEFMKFSKEWRGNTT